MADPATRAAARTAGLVALPIALLAGFLAYRTIGEEHGSEPARARSTTPVTMAAPRLDERPAAVCRALFARLPDRLGDLDRRPVTTGAEQNAAYGDPPVTLACGAAGPSAPAGAQFFELNGVCWYPQEGAEATVWVLRGREVPVVVVVPKEHTGQLLVDLAGPISATVASTGVACG